jgi:hypothetical protein
MPRRIKVWSEADEKYQQKLIRNDACHRQVAALVEINVEVFDNVISRIGSSPRSTPNLLAFCASVFWPQRVILTAHLNGLPRGN